MLSVLQVNPTTSSAPIAAHPLRRAHAGYHPNHSRHFVLLGNKQLEQWDCGQEWGWRLQASELVFIELPAVNAMREEEHPAGLGGQRETEAQP